MRVSLTAGLLVALVVLTFGTASPLAMPDRVIGVIGPGEFDQEPSPLVAPDTVQTCSTVEVEVTTTGPNMCWSADGAEVEHEGDVVTIVPYDLVEQGACAQAIVHPSRTVELQFDTPGEVTLRVQGRASQHDEEITSEVEKTLTVQ